ncbi:hypothetical protein BH09VER1_BH09VER1_00100 [soil metagenome]
MTPAESEKPWIIVVALSVDPHLGSEPGKGWWWSNALSEHFRLRIVTQRRSEAVCQNEAIPRSEGWVFHTTERDVSTWKFPVGYLQYRSWLQEALSKCREIVEQFPVVGLCHVTLGSFRFLPAYNQLGIPYTVGPLGGGECSPASFIWQRRMPAMEKVKEAMRPLINNSSALVPPLRACMKSASLVLTTSIESERVVRRIGAKKTAVVFSDAYETPVDFEAITEQRSLQMPSLGKIIHLYWQGRPLWWKGPDLALKIAQKALIKGVNIKISMVCNWDTPFGREVKALAEEWGVASNIEFVGYMARQEFLEMARRHHAFLGTSLHDSGGIPLIEAQALGLPCLTLALGGNRISACPDAGISGSAKDPEDYVNRVVDHLAVWQENPATWLEESQRAQQFAHNFTINRLRNYVNDLIVPAFSVSETKQP